MLDPETQSKISNWRRRAAAGETLSIEEMREAILLLRQGRLSASQAAATSKRSSGGRSKAPTKSADDLLSELGGL